LPPFSPAWNGACGLLLHPAIGASFMERAVIQGHVIVFTTVDLAAHTPPSGMS
jgi:5-methylcytosine-specific restriction enzyme subunit McrC